MKLLQTLVLLAFLPSVGYSQEINSENETQVTKVTENELLTLVSSNDVSADITVHTIKLRGVVLETENSDLLPEETLTEQVESILTEFSNLEGVQRCTFDKATQTFTVLTGPTTSIEKSIENINKK